MNYSCPIPSRMIWPYFGYFAFRDGTIIGPRGKKLSTRPHYGRHNKLYVKVNLGSRAKGILLHRIICEAFHGPPPFEKAQAGHLDDDGTNNKASNLRWMDNLENQRMKKK